jgi:hypothetical protein
MGTRLRLTRPGILHDIWFGDLEEILLCLAVFGVFLVYRWWALLPAVAPVVVTAYLHEMTDYVSPWHEDLYQGVSDHTLLLSLYLIGLVITLAAVLSVGLLLRAVWDWLRSGGYQGKQPGAKP